MDVINRKPPDENSYVTRWEEFELLPGALEGLQLLAELNARLLVVTNQRDIARGLMSERDLNGIHDRMRAEIAVHNGHLDGVYYCPHDEGTCKCRKPAGGLFHQARREFPEIAFAQSMVVGDSEADLEAAIAIGAHPVLITTRPEWPTIVERFRSADADALRTFPSLRAFAEALGRCELHL